MNIKLGEPIHGWLPVTVEHGAMSFMFEASDVPIDPVSRLIVSLNHLFTGRNSEVWWHLEPDGYYLDFKAQDGKFLVSFEFSNGSNRPRADLKFQFTDSIENIVVPIWREIKKFYSYKYSEPHWPPERKHEMEALTKHVKELRDKVKA